MPDPKEVGSVVSTTRVGVTSDPLDNERNNPEAIRRVMERYGVDAATATEMWHLVVDTVAQIRERTAAGGGT